MGVVLGMNRAVEEIRLSEDEDSPVFYLDLTDKSVVSKFAMIRESLSKYKKLIDDWTPETRQLSEDEQKAVTDTIKVVITAMLGERAYAEAVEWVKNGNDIPDEQITFVLTPLFLYLADAAINAMNTRQTESFKKYRVEANR